MVNTKKFSEFDAADINDSTTQDVGLSSGVNSRESKFYTWTTVGRPATPFNGLMGLNTTLQQYEFWDAVASQWTQFSDTNVFAILASHAPGEGAALIGLQNQSNVTNKFVQDLANATFIAQTDNGTLQNAQFLGSLVTGIVKNTTATGVLSISPSLTSIDALTVALGDTLYATAADTYTNLPGNITTTKQYLSQTGTGVISAAPEWATISGTDITGAALTKVDDTNVTLTLGGTPATALLRAASLTLGWTGLLSVPRGGTGAGTLTAHGILLGQGTSAITAQTLSDGQILIGNTGADPSASAISSGTGILVGNGAGSITVQLASVSDLRILANISGGAAAPTPNTLTAIIDACIGNVQGDLLYRNATSWVTLAPGTSGQFLQTQGAAANPQWVTSATVTPAALTKTDDTNVTLSLGGTPATALLQATSLTLGWTGSLSVPRGGTGNTTFTAYSVICAGTTATGAFQNVSGVGTLNQVLVSQGAGALPQWGSVPGLTPAALTKTDDTNVTLTLGGTPATALLQATSLTLGWTGQLGLTRGGTNASLTASNGGIVYSTATAMAILAGTATANQILLSGASGAPSWSTATYPATAGTSGNVLTSDGTNWTSAAPAASATSVIVDDTTTNATMYPIWVTASTGSLPLKVSSTKLSFNPSTAVLTLAGALSSSTGITSSAGLNLLTFTYNALATTYINIQNSTSSPAISALGSGSTAPLTLTSKNSYFQIYDNSNTVGAELRWYNAAQSHFTSLKVATAQATDVTFTLPAADGTSGQALITNASGVLSFGTAAIPVPTTQTFSSGSGTYTTPANVKYIRVRGWAGGGAGGGAAAAAAAGSAGGGGGGGGYFESIITSPAGTYSYGVGAGGTAGTAGNNPGNAGGNTTFSTFTANGGAGGGGGASIAGGYDGTPGAGGTASGANININGSPGLYGFVVGATAATVQGGTGGTGASGGGGGIANAGGNAGAAGTTYGGGGSGASQFGAGGALAGGAGAAGFIIVTEYYG